MVWVTGSQVRITHLAKTFSMIGFLALCCFENHPVDFATPRPTVASHLFYPEVRLRKLHLVRPDLIPYPIYYDIYC